MDRPRGSPWLLHHGVSCLHPWPHPCCLLVCHSLLLGEKGCLLLARGAEETGWLGWHSSCHARRSLHLHRWGYACTWLKELSWRTALKLELGSHCGAHRRRSPGDLVG